MPFHEINIDFIFISFLKTPALLRRDPNSVCFSSSKQFFFQWNWFFFQMVKNQFHELYIFWFFWRFNKFIFFFIIYSITLFKVFLLLSSTLIAHTHQSIQSIFIFSFFFRQNHTQHYILWNIRDLWHMMCLVGNQK